MSVACRTERVFVHKHGVIFPRKGNSILRYSRATIERRLVLQVCFQESEHLSPGFSLGAAGFDALRILDKGMRLSIVNCNFVRDTRFGQCRVESLHTFHRDALVRAAENSENGSRQSS